MYCTYKYDHDRCNQNRLIDLLSIRTDRWVGKPTFDLSSSYRNVTLGDWVEQVFGESTNLVFFLFLSSRNKNSASLPFHKFRVINYTFYIVLYFRIMLISFHTYQISPPTVSAANATCADKIRERYLVLHNYVCTYIRLSSIILLTCD